MLKRGKKSCRILREKLGDFIQNLIFTTPRKIATKCINYHQSSRSLLDCHVIKQFLGILARKVLLFITGTTLDPSSFSILSSSKKPSENEQKNCHKTLHMYMIGNEPV